MRRICFSPSRWSEHPCAHVLTTFVALSLKVRFERVKVFFDTKNTRKKPLSTSVRENTTHPAVRHSLCVERVRNSVSPTAGNKQSRSKDDQYNYSIINTAAGYCCHNTTWSSSPSTVAPYLVLGRVISHGVRRAIAAMSRDAGGGSDLFTAVRTRLATKKSNDLTTKY